MSCFQLGDQRWFFQGMTFKLRSGKGEGASYMRKWRKKIGVWGGCTGENNSGNLSERCANVLRQERPSAFQKLKERKHGWSKRDMGSIGDVRMTRKKFTFWKITLAVIYIAQYNIQVLIARRKHQEINISF